MNLITLLGAIVISIPARLKGVVFGKGSFIGPGYDWLNVNLRGLKLGDNVLIGRNAWIQLSGDNKPEITLKNGTNCGRNLTISCIKKITIGEKCLLSYNVSLIDHEHDYFNPNVSPMEAPLTEGKEIVIGDHSFIGAHSFVMAGVVLGKHCVVGANSVVTKSFPDYSIIGGIPAKLIRTLG